MFKYCDAVIFIGQRIGGGITEFIMGSHTSTRQPSDIYNDFETI